MLTAAPETCVKMTVPQTVLIRADTDNSLWKTATFSQSLLQDINIQYSLENALSYEDMQVWVCVCARACEYNIRFAAGGQSMHNNETL